MRRLCLVPGTLSGMARKPWERDLASERLAHERGEGPKPEPDATAVYIGNGMFLSRRFGAEFDDSERGLHVGFEGLIVDGKPACMSLTLWRLDGEPLTRDDLRNVSLGEYVAQAAAEQAFVLREGESIESLAPAQSGDFAAVREQLPRQRRRVTENDLRRVAATYRAAHRAGLPPTQAVMEGEHVSRAQAGRLVKRARGAGFLGPAAPRKSGELPPEDETTKGDNT